MYYVYLTASRTHGTLYLGVTNNLVRRIHEHKTKVTPRFTSQYKWRRDWKIRLIEKEKPEWLDLYSSITREAAEYRFRARPFGPSRNDEKNNVSALTVNSPP